MTEKLKRLSRQFNASGLQLGHRYDNSPICIPDGSPAPPDEPNHYVPVARPGSRAPHLWLEDGRSTLDLFSGKDFTLLCLGDDAPDTSKVEQAAAIQGIPLTVHLVTQANVCGLYAARLVLVRPDGYVAWRGNDLPQCSDALQALMASVCGVKAALPETQMA